MTPPLDFEDLVTRHQGAVCAIAYAVLRDRARSEEVAQDAFLVAWQKLPGMSPAPSLPGWVCGIARNLARNAARRRRETAMTTETATEAPSALDQMITKERAALANRALEKLSEREREAIVLYYRGDESLATVAAALGISEAAAKKRVLRGRDHLRAEMSDVETTLRGTRPGPAFAAGCVAALALGTGVKSASAASRTSASTKLWIAAAVAVPFVTLATLGVAHVARTSSAPAGQVDASTTARTQRSEDITTPPHSRRIDPEARRQLEARIDQARTKRLATATPAVAPVMPKIYDFTGSNLFDEIPAPPPAAGAQVSDKRVLRGAVRSVQPLIRECYDREGHGARGTLELYVRLEGEADTGTIATDARVDGEFAKNAALAECVRESLLSIALPDVELGGVVDLDYPFTI